MNRGKIQDKDTEPGVCQLSIECDLHVAKPHDSVRQDYCDTNVHLINFNALTAVDREHLHQQNAFVVKYK